MNGKNGRMKILHTSDWHIGRSLYGHKRYEEFELFLSWLVETIREEHVDVLLVAGDIFDTSTPSNRAQSLYYRFLCHVATSACRHVIVIAGNHDSPTFLDAPKELLHALDVHVVGSMTQHREDEVFVLKNQNDIPELIVCAVPYLRDRDIRMAGAGESIEDKERNLIEGIRAHYADVCALAEQRRQELGGDIPIVAMGHLFTAGGKTIDGDGVRELYVGSLAHVSAVIFPACIDYLALGHLHVPQLINQSEKMRYSGSPIAMGFGEANQVKSVCMVEFTGINAAVSLINVPVFQQLKRISGNRSVILAEIQLLAEARSQAWIEVVYEGDEIVGDLRECIEAAVLGTEIQLLRIKNNRIIDRVLNRIQDDETLDDLNVKDVFERCLAMHNIPEDQRLELLCTYQETITYLNEVDARAE
jgi:exonuclease SbcD